MDIKDNKNVETFQCNQKNKHTLKRLINIGVACLF